MSGTNVDEVLRYKGFDVEIKGVDGVTATFACDTVATGVGTPSRNGGVPGSFLEHVVLRTELLTGSSAQRLVRWIDDTVSRGDGDVTVTITPIPLDGSLGARWVFLDCFPVRYTPPRVLPPDPCAQRLEEEIRFVYRSRITLPPPKPNG